MLLLLAGWLTGCRSFRSPSPSPSPATYHIDELVWCSSLKLCRFFFSRLFQQNVICYDSICFTFGKHKNPTLSQIDPHRKSAVGFIICFCFCFCSVPFSLCPYCCFFFLVEIVKQTEILFLRQPPILFITIFSSDIECFMAENFTFFIFYSSIVLMFLQYGRKSINFSVVRFSFGSLRKWSTHTQTNSTIQHVMSLNISH